MPDNDTTWFVQTCYLRTNQPPVIHLYGPFTKEKADSDRRGFLHAFAINEDKPWDAVFIAKVSQPVNVEVAAA